MLRWLRRNPPLRWIIPSIAIAAAILGAANATGFDFESPIVGLAVFGVVAVAVAAFLFLRRRDGVEEQALPIEDLPRVKIGADPLAIRHANGLAFAWFGNDNMNIKELGAIYERCPEALTVAYDALGAAKGYVDLFPVDQETGTRLLSGKMDERKIRAAMVLSFRDWLSQQGDRYVYFAGIVVEGVSPFQRGLYVQVLLAATRELLKSRALGGEQDSFVALATAYSDSGEALLTKLGFSFAGTKNRLGRVFVRKIGATELDQLGRRLPAIEHLIEWLPGAETGHASKEDTL